MRKLPVSVVILMSLCFFFACLIAGVSFLAVILAAAEVGGALPLRYLEQLNLPTIMVAFPVFGMLLASVIALVMWRRREAATEAVVEEKTTLPQASPGVGAFQKAA